VKICCPKSKVKVMVIFPSQKRAHKMFIVNDRVKILDLFKGNMSVVKVGQEYGGNEWSICRIILNSMHPEHSAFPQWGSP
jgi:hypothetical protein